MGPRARCQWSVALGEGGGGGRRPQLAATAARRERRRGSSGANRGKRGSKAGKATSRRGDPRTTTARYAVTEHAPTCCIMEDAPLQVCYRSRTAGLKHMQDRGCCRLKNFR